MSSKDGLEIERELETAAAAWRVAPPAAPPAPPGAGAGPPASPGGPAAYRGRLLKRHLRAANAAYLSALRTGTADPVVVIAELDDPRTRRFPVTLMRRGWHPPGQQVVVFAAERDHARSALLALTTHAGAAVEARRADGYLAVVAGAGGLAFTLVSLPRKES